MSEKKPSFWSSLPGILTGFAALIAAVVGLLTLLGVGGSEDSTTSSSAPVTEPARPAEREATAAASITDPVGGDGVCVQQRVRGTTTGLPESSNLWLFVYAPGIGRYLPADEARRTSRDGKTLWTADVDFSTGNPHGDLGQTYQLIIVSADRSASEVLAHVRPGSELERLPTGTRRLDAVFVTTGAC